MIGALRGRISVRQLRVMVEGLGDDRVLSEALTGSPWLDRDWVAHDHDYATRQLLATLLSFLGSSKVTLPPLPSPLDDVELEVDEEQLELEAELLATVNREGD